MNIVIFGPPASGKGTQASLIADRYSLHHLVMSSFLRDEILSGSKLGKEIAAKINVGKLVDDSLLCSILESNLKRIFSNNTKGVIFDGVPRTFEQSVFLDKILKQLNQKIDVVIKISVDEQTLLDRTSSRFVCISCSASDSSELECSKCLIKMVKRIDDTIEVFRDRLKIFNDMLEKIDNFYKNSSVKMINIDGNKNISQVFSDIVQHFEMLKNDY